MFLIRQARPADLGILLKLSKMVHFINLPADKDIIAEKIRRSTASFELARGPQPGANGAATGHLDALGGRSPLFMFVMEESSTGNALGTASIIAKMGTPGNPNLAMQLRRRQFFSRDLQTGVTHVTAQLVLDEDGPTEIGGLILGPSYRGHPEKLGMQLSLIRFHYMGLHRDQIEDRLLAEMMGSLTPDGNNTLWEYFGRRFINLSYADADRFCAFSREFMTSLLPREEIYLTLLPPEARALIGQVGAETKPARAMLERLGFVNRDLVDPFDGGPHLEAATDDIALVRDTRPVEVTDVCSAADTDRLGFISFEGGARDREFRAMHAPYAETSDGSGVLLPKAVLKAIHADTGAVVGLTPLEASVGGRREADEDAESAPREQSSKRPRRRTGARKAAT